MESNKIKLLIVIPSFYPAYVYGGPIFSTYKTCTYLSKLGININVSTTNSNKVNRLEVKANTSILYNENFNVIYYNENWIEKFSISLLVNLWNDIKKAELIHIQAVYNYPVPIAFFCSKIFKKPIVYSPRGALNTWGLQKKGLIKKLWLRFLIKPFIKNINWHVTSTKEKEEVIAIFPNAKTTIIHNGIDLKIKIIPNGGFLNKFLPESLTYSKVIVSMGRIHKVKGFDILINCLSKIHRLYSDSILIIAGKDEGELDNLKQICKQLNIIDKVFFVGNVLDDEKYEFLSKADLFVLPSHTENFGNVYAEALAAGTPIVASTNTPWEEVEAAGCGRWVPNTVEDTTAAILDLLSRDREQLRQNALKYVQKFDWKNIALQFKELYEKVLNEHESKKK